MDNSVSSNILDKENFFSALDCILPGSSNCGGKIISEDYNRVYFERVSIDGLLEMHEYSTDKRLYQFLEFDPFTTVHETELYINKLLSRIGDDVQSRTAMYWFARRKSDGALLGSIGLLNISYARLSSEWGFGVNPKYWAGGYVFDILKSVMQYAFETLGLNRLVSTTANNNESTIAVLQSLGFQFEGELRDYYRFSNGAFQNAAIYGLLARDYLNGKQITIPNLNSNNNELEQKVINILSEVLESDSVDRNTRMIDEPRWDSLKHVAIMLNLIENFEVQLSPDHIANANSVEAICAILKGDVSNV